MAKWILTSDSGKTKTDLTEKEKENAIRLQKGEIRACPKCGEPIEYTATYCNSCGTFIDPNTGAIHNQHQVYEAELNDLLQKEAKSAAQGTLFIIGGIIVAIAGALIGSMPGLVIIGGGITCAIFGLWRQAMSKRAAKKKVGAQIAATALNEVFEQVDYREAEHLSESVIRSVDMGMMDFDRVSGSDYVKAVYKGVNIEMSDICLSRVDTEIDEDGKEHEKVTNVFVGLWMICDFKKALSADLRLRERSKLGQKLAFGGINTDNEGFNKQFHIQSNSPHDVFYILTPHMMEYIQQMDVKANGDLYMRFLREGKLHIAVNSGRNLFEIKNLNTNATALRRQFVGEICYVTDLIDEMRLVDTLFKK